MFYCRVATNRSVVDFVPTIDDCYSSDAIDFRISPTDLISLIKNYSASAGGSVDVEPLFVMSVVFGSCVMAALGLIAGFVYVKLL